MTTREEVEQWLKQMPNSLIQEQPLQVRELHDNIYTPGKATPEIVTLGYQLTLNLRCDTWEEKE